MPARLFCLILTKGLKTYCLYENRSKTKGHTMDAIVNKIWTIISIILMLIAMPLDSSDIAFARVIEPTIPMSPPSHWDFKPNTGNNATVVLPTTANPNIGGSPLQNGDYLGVFTPAGLCCGWSQWTSQNTAITAWGDDDQTTETDGLKTGEKINYRVYRESTGKEWQEVTVGYSQGSGNYSANSFMVLNQFDVTDDQPLPEGNKWVTQTSGVAQRLHCVDAVSDQIGWAGGDDGTVLRTTNGGSNWEPVGNGLGTIGIVSIDALSDQIALAAGYSNDASSQKSTATIFKTTNGGTTWIKVYELYDAFINNITMRSTSNGMAIGDPRDGKWLMMETKNGGDTWSSWDKAPPASEGEYGGTANVFWYSSNDCWIGSSTQPHAYHSTDGCNTWNNVTFPVITNVYSLTINTSGIGLIGGEPKTLIRTTDGGNNWNESAIAVAGIIPRALKYHEGQFYLLQGNGVYTSTDDGNTWALDGSATAALYQISLKKAQLGTYGWAVGRDGVILRCVPKSVGVEHETPVAPEHIVLEQNYPNPFNATTKISFSLPSSCRISLDIYDLKGRKMATLAEGFYSAGLHTITWQAADLASGVYFYKISTEEGISGIKKLLLVK